LSDPIALGRSVIEEEARALADLARSLGDSFGAAVRRILTMPSGGRVIVCGLGKSGLIARKIAATLSSTGTAAVYMHPVEGLHGDLGMVGGEDLLIALSKSGQTEELVRFANHFRRVGGHVIAICEGKACPLTELADVSIALPAHPEAGPLSLAPTTSTTLMLALGDALAMALLDGRGFKEEDFARYHPEGSLGRRLLTRAADVMHGGRDLPRVGLDSGFRELLQEMTAKHLGMVCLVDPSGKLFGVFTEGDLRRLLERNEQPMKLVAREAWRLSRRDPDEVQVKISTVSPDTLAIACLEIMRTQMITSLVVTDDQGSPAGVVRLQDLVRAGIS
jgi:arabinose-5-phosphate isomerase